MDECRILTECEHVSANGTDSCCESDQSEFRISFLNMVLRLLQLPDVEL